jgi:putative oxidoreductase
MISLHGLMKFNGGEETIEKVGSSVNYLGIDSGHLFFGYVAATIEFIGGLLIMTGLFFTPACVMLFLVLSVAAIMKISKGGGFLSFSYPLEMAFIFISLALTGAGKYSFDNKILNINANRNSGSK